MLLVLEIVQLISSGAARYFWICLGKKQARKLIKGDLYYIYKHSSDLHQCTQFTEGTLQEKGFPVPICSNNQHHWRKIIQIKPGWSFSVLLQFEMYEHVTSSSVSIQCCLFDSLPRQVKIVELNFSFSCIWKMISWAMFFLPAESCVHWSPLLFLNALNGQPQCFQK